MKAYTKLFLTALGLSAALYSCSPERVKPRDEANDGNPTLGLADQDTHLILTPYCSDFDTLPLMSQNSSLTVNYQCTSNCPQWGTVSTYNSTEYFVANFRLATGWFVDFANSQFAVLSSFNIVGNVPQTTNDWFSYNPNPDVNTWQMVVPLDSIERDQSNCFYFAARLSVVKRTFFGGQDPNSRRTLWAYNPGWNIPGDENFAPSQFINPTCWAFCPPAADTVCESFLTGLPSSVSGGNCTTLAPDVSNITTEPVSYQWSTGENTSTISVCPTTSTTYSVTITETASRVPVAVKVYTLNAWDVQCYAGNSPHHKVKVCHLPPGNPSNIQDLCLDWGGVPAHVARFRTPAMNPRLGHDSGCEIGECGGGPCD